MISLQDMTDQELIESIEAWQEEIDNSEYGYNSSYAEAEIHVQTKELERRQRMRNEK